MGSISENKKSPPVRSQGGCHKKSPENRIYFVWSILTDLHCADWLAGLGLNKRTVRGNFDFGIGQHRPVLG